MKLAHIATFALAISLTACGSDSKSKATPMPPLTPAQKADVTYVSASMDAAHDAATRAGGVNMNGTLNLIDPNQANKQLPIVVEGTGTAPNPINKEEKTAQLTDWLRQSPACQFDNQMPDKSNGDPKNGDFHFKVTGEGCPIAMSMQFGYKTVQNANTLNMRIRVAQEYKVLDDNYGRMNDVTAANIKGDFGVQGSNLNNNAATASGGGSLNGSIESRRFGTIGMSVGMSMNANRNGMTSSMSISMRFKDFTAVGKVVASAPANGPEKVTYLINDQAVTQKEFDDVFGSAAHGLANGGNGNGNNGDFPTEMMAQ